MKAKSADYIQLQNIYKAKARKDIAEVTDTVRLLEKKVGRTATVDAREIEAFCKSAGHIKLVRGRCPHIVKQHDPVSWKECARSAGE